ncbi:MAG: GNAT family N-acetyltransferase [Armatimonadota bacterium]|nr:MAG: GNAT family N-acetyltransferase [Armatimonadota bacterium]
MALTSPEGIPITVRAIERGDLGCVLLRCLPDGGNIEGLFNDQGTIGMAAWAGDRCVGQLHCYRVILPEGMSKRWPEWSRWLPESSWWSEAAHTSRLGLGGPAWCHACFHVGRTLESAAVTDDPDPRYHGRGIGTALCRESVRWARHRDYALVVALGAPEGLLEYAAWAGQLPWTTYAKLGFGVVGFEVQSKLIPGWAEGNSPPEVMAEVRAAMARGRPKSDFCSRVMALDLRRVPATE